MSSHHIVREKQEPALLILSLDGFDDEQLGQLLEWSPTVMSTSPVAEQLHAFGIKIDWIITDDVANNLQSDIKYLSTNNKQANAAALDYLVEKGYPAVNIVTDEFNLEQYQPYADKITLVIFYQQQKIYRIESGFSKWKPGGDVIRIISQVKNLKTHGLQQIAENVYVTIADGFFGLHFDNGPLFIAEDL
ncbi:thiamine diphosphokinase [Mucilaginibacter panaciglaebae]|uniref:Thiamine diphosphokinase n=1 Tax=Mucilaginibacter panaciglaebae TaxID=502331 RepID=A0ABP7WY71_9SPHI